MEGRSGFKSSMLYPSYDAVLEAHKVIVGRTGGEAGMVSASNLAYVLDAVKHVGARLPDREAIRRKGGYLLYGIVVTHPFSDGNKRTALEVTKSFLKLNGWLFEPDERDAFDTLLLIARGELGAAGAEEWIGSNLRRIKAEK